MHTMRFGYALGMGEGDAEGSECLSDIPEAPIKAAAARLPSDVSAEAQARGRARDLRATLAELPQRFDGGEREPSLQSAPSP